MRTRILIACVLCACSPKDAKKADTAVMAEPAAAPAPAALTAEMVKGTWNGVSMAEKSDSVIGRWTSSSPTGTEAAVVTVGMKDTVRYPFTFAGDSVVAVSQPVPASPAKNAPKVITRVVARMVGGKLVGTGVTVLAAKPDSVVLRGRWEATRQP